MIVKVAKAVPTRWTIELECGHEPGCSDCETMTHCETHHKVEGLYPEPRTTPARKDG